MRKKALLFLVVAVLVAVFYFGSSAVNPAKAAAADSAFGKTYPTFVFHGIPGVPVDVYVNNQLAIPDFQPGTTVGPLNLAPNYYTVALYPAGAHPATTPAIVKTSIFVSSNVAPVSIVARLNGNGQPAVQTFIEGQDFFSIPGEAMIAGRNASAQDFPGFSFCYQAAGNPFKTPAVNQYSPAGTYTLYAAPFGDSLCNHPVASTTIQLQAGVNVIATLVGNANNGSAQLFVERIPDQGDEF